MRSLRYHRAEIFPKDDAANVSGLPDVEDDDRQAIVLTQCNCGHIHDFSLPFQELDEPNLFEKLGVLVT